MLQSQPQLYICFILYKTQYLYSLTFLVYKGITQSSTAVSGLDQNGTGRALLRGYNTTYLILHFKHHAGINFNKNLLHPNICTKKSVYKQKYYNGIERDKRTNSMLAAIHWRTDCLQHNSIQGTIIREAENSYLFTETANRTFAGSGSKLSNEPRRPTNERSQQCLFVPTVNTWFS